MEDVAGLRFLPVKLTSKNIDGNTETIDDYILVESILNPEGLKTEQEN